MCFSAVTYSYQLLLQSSYGILLDTFTQYVIYSENMDDQSKRENEWGRGERDSAQTEADKRLGTQVPQCLGRFGAFWFSQQSHD